MLRVSERFLESTKRVGLIETAEPLDQRSLAIGHRCADTHANNMRYHPQQASRAPAAVMAASASRKGVAYANGSEQRSVHAGHRQSAGETPDH